MVELISTYGGDMGTASSQRRMWVWRTATAVAISGAVGSCLDWLVVASQLSYGGSAYPFQPPLAVIGAASALLIAGLAIRFSSSKRPRPLLGLLLTFLGVALVWAAFFLVARTSGGLGEVAWTLLWAGPIALVAIPLSTLLGLMLPPRAQTWTVLVGGMITAITVISLIFAYSSREQ